MKKKFSNMYYDFMPNIGQEEKRKLAKEFSERNPQLEDLLLYLWDHGINTISSCAGHRMRTDIILDKKYCSEKTKPYIFFHVDSFSCSELECLLSNYFYTSKNINMHFQIKTKDNYGQRGLCIKFPYHRKDSCFQQFKLLIENTLHHKLESKIRLLTNKKRLLLEDILSLLNLKRADLMSDNSFEDVTRVGVYVSKFTSIYLDTTETEGKEPLIHITYSNEALLDIIKHIKQHKLINLYSSGLTK